MHASKVKQNASSDNPEETEASAMERQKKAKNRRRLADSLKEKGRKLNLDRRFRGRDRRMNEAAEYKGPARRKVIDRREKLNDRRDED